MNVLDFLQYKKINKKISMVTSYEAWSAKIIEASPIDCILVGDSVAMVVHGFDSTLHATPEMIATHVAAVRRGAPKKFIVADMPFPWFRKGIPEAMNCVDLFMKAGANCVKIEGVIGHEDVIQNIVQSGVPVMGHLGLTPQSIHALGGFKVQGRSDEAARSIIEQAIKLEDLGAFSVVLECVPQMVSKTITKSLEIPTIGIGAGIHVDGQVLVLQDLLGLNGEFHPKFLKKYLNGSEAVIKSLANYDTEVKGSLFPTEKESYV
ncbi:MAG: 3-methyl-2-oxobutanoate hydroxymethyltransferase [Bdellovibrionales bacterium]